MYDANNHYICDYENNHSAHTARIPGHCRLCELAPVEAHAGIMADKGRGDGAFPRMDGGGLRQHDAPQKRIHRDDIGPV